MMHSLTTAMTRFQSIPSPFRFAVERRRVRANAARSGGVRGGELEDTKGEGLDFSRVGRIIDLPTICTSLRHGNTAVWNSS